uniref:Uncharacterized protein n=1 Tax=Limosilactobacillus reuteri TaxID=1598 RepID=B2BCT8_LIMRT|nr:unknown extracellular protein [Limosilactobacillus reuteri]
MATGSVSPPFRPRKRPINCQTCWTSRLPFWWVWILIPTGLGSKVPQTA